MPAPRSGITPKLRWQVFARDGFRCRYCGAQGGDVVLVVDHVRAVARGGSDRIGNLITACEVCNQGKADAAIPTMAEFDLYYRTARIAALWMRFLWQDLIRESDKSKLPSQQACMAVVRNSPNVYAAIEVLERVAEKYRAGWLGNGAWAGDWGYDWDAVLEHYSEWIGGWETDETPEERDAQFWAQIPD